MSTTPVNAGFARSSRLVKPAQFQQVFKQPRKSGDKHLLVLARNNECGHARLGLAVSVKASGNAVVRNRVKRVARESFRHFRMQLGGVDLVVTGRGGLDKRSKKELRTALDRHWFILTHAKIPAPPA